MAQVLNYKKIALAREFRGLTQTRLASLLHVSQGKVSKIEQGLLGVSEELLGKISEVLRFPQNFFYGSAQVYPPMTPFHRKKKRLAQKVQKRIEAKANVYRQQIMALQGSVDIDTDVPHLDPDDYNGKAENVAIALRYYWRLPKGPIENLTNVIENAGIIIIPFDFNTDLLDGFTLITPEALPVIFVNSSLPGDRLRFTLAHELGHIIMHTLPSIKMEDEANRFASELLMPSEEIRSNLMRLNIDKLAALKPYWKVSMAALLVKAGERHGIGVITYNQERYLWQQMAPYRTVEPPQLDVQVEQPSLFKELLEVYFTELGYSISELCELLCIYEKDFEEFFPPERKHRHLKLVPR